MFESQSSDFEIGPLRPIQRPLMALGLILVIYFGIGLVFSLFRETEAVIDSARHKSIRPAEIKFRTIHTSATSNDRLTSIHQSLQKMDTLAKDYFEEYGRPHKWHDPDNEAAPRIINRFNHELNDGHRFLIEYNDIAETYRDYSEAYRNLAESVDGSVSDLGPSPTADREFQALRLLRNDVNEALRILDRQTGKLVALGTRYQEGI